MAKDVEVQRRLAISRVPINKQDPEAAQEELGRGVPRLRPGGGEDRGDALHPVPDGALPAGLPGRQRHPGRVQAARDRRHERRRREVPRDQQPARAVRPALPAGAACARASASSPSRSGPTCTRSRRYPSASSRRSSPTTSAKNFGVPLPVLPAPSGFTRRRRRRGTGGHGRRGGAGEAGPHMRRCTTPGRSRAACCSTASRTSS